MRKLFDKNYFYGGSNYSNYELFRHESFSLGKINNILKFKKSGKLLDVGCALGYFAKFMKKRGFDVYGVDISEFAINKCKKLVKSENFYVGNISKNLPFKKDSFDVVTAFDVVEHIKGSDYKKTIKNIVSVLKKGGIIAFSVPLKVEGSLKYVAIDKDKTHVSIIPEKEFFGVLKENKLKILVKKYYLNLFGLTIVPIIFKLLGTNILVICEK